MFKKTKFLLVVGFLVAWLIFLCAPIFAYESTEIDYDVYWQNSLYPNSSSTRYIIYDSGSNLSSDYITVADTYMFGYQLSTAIPYYADGDHVSVFCSFGFAIPRVNFQGTDNKWEGQYYIGLGPAYYRTDLLYSDGNLGNNLFNIADFVYNNYTVQQKTGSLQWQGLQNGSFKALIYHGGSSTAQGITDYEYFFVNLQLDLNITQGYELMPLSLYIYQSRQSAGAYDSYKVDVRPTFRMNDTSMYGLLENIESAISNIDFSGLEGLSQLSTITQNIYTQIISNGNILESILDDDETDRDITEWANQASEFESAVSNLSDIEESLKGTIEEYTFPSAPNQTANMNIVGMFFSNELIIALTLAFLTMTIAMLLLF